jgi:hypothetical protein
MRKVWKPASKAKPLDIGGITIEELVDKEGFVPKIEEDDGPKNNRCKKLPLRPGKPRDHICSNLIEHCGSCQQQSSISRHLFHCQTHETSIRR